MVQYIGKVDGKFLCATTAGIQLPGRKLTSLSDVVADAMSGIPGYGETLMVRFESVRLIRPPAADTGRVY